MITAFSIVKDGKRFRFVAKDISKYQKNTPPTWVCACNGHVIDHDTYQRNLTGFKASRK